MHVYSLQDTPHCKAFANDGALISRNKKLTQALKGAQKAINVQWNGPKRWAESLVLRRL
jgi:hypothetical protein